LNCLSLYVGIYFCCIAWNRDNLTSALSTLSLVSDSSAWKWYHSFECVCAHLVSVIAVTLYSVISISADTGVRHCMHGIGLAVRYDTVVLVVPMNLGTCDAARRDATCVVAEFYV